MKNYIDYTPIYEFIQRNYGMYLLRSINLKGVWKEGVGVMTPSSREYEAFQKGDMDMFLQNGIESLVLNIEFTGRTITADFGLIELKM